MAYLRIPFLFLLIAITLTPEVSYAEISKVEKVASEIARQFNSDSESMKDDIIVSSSAEANGSNVTMKFVWRVKRDLSKQMLDELRLDLYKDIVPKTCRVNSNNPAFKDGLSYTFVYISHYAQLLAKILVNKRTCNDK